VTRAAVLVASIVAAGACGKAKPDLDVARAAALFDRVRVDTDNGLSGLAIDDAGAIWTESERDASVFRIVLDGTRVASTTRYAVTNAPPDADLEAIAWLGPGKLAFGTEGHDDERAQIALASIDEARHAITIDRTIDLPRDRLGLTVAPNDGVEGLCAAGEVVYATVESNAIDDHGRWAPLARLDLRSGDVQIARFALTSDRGKLSSLDCTLAPDGGADLLLIERHFGITNLLRAHVPPALPARVEPRAVLDLAPVLRGALNLEGIGVLHDGRVIAVVDNQYKGITGPNELLVFKPGSVPSAP
jgi:hypothetical protein